MRKYSVRTMGMLSLCMLLMPAPSSAEKPDWLQVGVRSGAGETGNGFEMKQYELYSVYRLPWGYRFSSASALTTRLDSTIGGLEHQAQTGFIATSSPTLALGLAHDKVSLNGGVGGAVLTHV